MADDDTTPTGSTHADEARTQDALGRLRASDPAAGLSPDAARLERLTDERRHDELAARRERRPRPWVTVAAVAAGALVVGGAGYGLGVSRLGPADNNAGTEVAAVGEGARDDAGGSSGTSGAAARPEIGQPEPFSASSGISHALPSFGGQGRMTFSSSGLSNDTGRAAAWAFDAGEVDAATAARAAEVFAVAGEPEEEYGMWRVGSMDGTAPTLTLSRDGAAWVSFHDPAIYELLDQGGTEPMPLPMPEPDMIEPETIEPDRPASDGDESSTMIAPAPSMAVPPQPTGPVPAEAAAAFTEAMTALGLDPTGLEIESTRGGPESAVVGVVAHHVLDGDRTGYSWSAEIGGDRVYSFYGPLAPVVELGDYDVVSPVQAVERLSDPRFGGTPVWTAGVEVMGGPVEWGWGEQAGPAPAAGSAIEWPVTDVVLAEADLTLTQHTAANGSMLLLPAYELSTAQGQTWQVLALADHELAF